MVFTKHFSVGDGTTNGDYLDMTDASKWIEAGGDWGDAEDESGRPLARRTITRQLVIKGASMDAAWDNHAALQRKLNQAREAASTQGGTVVTWGVQMNTGQPAYFDVLGGRITGVDQHPEANYIGCTLELSCLPYARGTAVALSASGTITNTAGTAATPGNTGQGGIFIADVPGDAPALCQVLLTDVSLNSQVINRVRMGVANRDVMSATDWPGWIDGVANSPGAAHTGDANRVGANYGTVVTSDAWQDVIDVTFGTADKQRGELDVWVRALTNADVQPPAGISATLGNGTLQTATTFTIRISSLVGSDESASSDAFTKATGNTVADAIVLSWTPTGTGITSHRVYYMGGTISSWRFQATGSGAGTFTLSSPNGTNGTPPSSTTIEPPYLRAQFGLASLTKLQNGPALQQMNGGAAGTSWAMNYLGRHIAPPWPRAEGAADIGTKAIIQAVSGYPGYAPWVRLDCAVVMPPWPQIACEVNGLALATQREWLIDTDRFGRSGCLLRSKADQTEQGQADVTGELYLLPGDNTIVINADITGGESDVVNTAYTAQVTYRPRFKFMRGSL